MRHGKQELKNHQNDRITEQCNLTGGSGQAFYTLLGQSYGEKSRRLNLLPRCETSCRRKGKLVVLTNQHGSFCHSSTGGKVMLAQNTDIFMENFHHLTNEES